MKALIIGDANSIWVKTTIEKTLLEYGDDCDILTFDNSNYEDFYLEAGVRVILMRNIGTGIRQLLNGYLNKSVFNENYDIVNIQFAALPYLVLLPFARKNCKRVIVSFWGSDILRQKKRNRLTYYLLRYADVITMSTTEMVKKFKYLYGEELYSKVKIAHFGSNVISEIDMINDHGSVRRNWGIPRDKITISIGYNADSAQNHIPVLEQIKKLPQDDKNKIHILMRLTYGLKSKEYINSITDAVKQTGCTYTLFFDYLSPKQSAEVTCITDIFIHAQKSDARSASMCEHLYAGCLVINPKWINYSEIDAFDLKFEHFEELNEIILDNLCYKTENKYKVELSNNKEIIKRLISWEYFIPAWRRIMT